MDLSHEMFGRKHVRVSYLWNLVVGLPPTSLSRREATGEEYWSTSDKLMALTLEGIDGLAYIWTKANSKKGTRIPKPLHVAWPGRKSNRAPTRVILNQAPTDKVKAVRNVMAGKIKKVPRGS